MIIFVGEGNAGEFQLITAVNLSLTYVLEVSLAAVSRGSYRRYAGVFQFWDDRPRPGQRSQIFYDQLWLPATVLNINYVFTSTPTSVWAYWYEDVDEWVLHGF